MYFSEVIDEATGLLYFCEGIVILDYDDFADEFYSEDFRDSNTLLDVDEVYHVNTHTGAE